MWARLAMAIAVLGLLAGALPARAQERGALTIEIKSGDGERKAHRLYSASHALVIGIDRYTEKGWQPLRNAVRDAGLVAEALKAQGFEVSLRTDLTSAELFPALQAFFISKGRDPGARLLLWFAGHGHTLAGPSSEEGYLVPADAPSAETDTEFRLKAVALRQFSYLMTQAKAKHVLAVLDSCFSGNVLAITRDAELTAPPEITQRTDGLARQMISAGDRNQKVSDNGQFRQLFIDAITGKVRNLGTSGYVTARNLGDHLRNEMTALTARTATPQTPNTGYLNEAGFNHGDFVFKVPPATPVLPAAAVDAVPKVPQAPAPAPLSRTLPPLPVAPAPAPQHSLFVEFSGMAAWQTIRTKLASIAAISDLDVTGLAARGARLTLRYAGDTPALAAVLAPHGLTLKHANGQWVLSSSAPAATSAPPAAAAPASPSAPVADAKAHARAVQTELARLGCFTGTASGDWGPRTRLALERFNQRVARPVAVTRTAADVDLALLRATRAPLCPPQDCKEGETEQDGKCAATTASTGGGGWWPWSTPSAPADAGCDKIDQIESSIRALVLHFERVSAEAGTLPVPAVSLRTLEAELDLVRARLGVSACGASGSSVNRARRDSLETQLRALESQLQKLAIQPASGAPASPGIAAATATPQPKSIGSAKQLYEKAYGDLLQQDYAAAETAFREFLAQHPRHELASNASYWVGETHFVRGDFKAAGKAFLQSSESYPSGAKAPDSLLKLGMTLDRLGQKTDACASFAEVARRHPTASQHVLSRAKAERERLGCK